MNGGCAVAIDTLLVVVGIYGTVDDAKADYELVGDLHTEADLIDAYDAAVIERTDKGKTIAALLATTSSTNATLYASGSLTAMLAESGQFPPAFGAQSRLGRHGGLVITAALVLVVANMVDLSAIASVGSAIALAVFVLVGIAGYRRRADTGANTAVTIAAIGVSAVVLAFFAVDTLRNAPWTFVAIIVIAVLAVVLDALRKRRAPAAGAGPETG